MADNILELSPEGAKRIKKGQMLGFDKAGERHWYLVKRKVGRKAWLKRAQLLRPEVFEEHKKHDIITKRKPWRCATCNSEL